MSLHRVRKALLIRLAIHPMARLSVALHMTTPPPSVSITALPRLIIFANKKPHTQYLTLPLRDDYLSRFHLNQFQSVSSPQCQQSPGELTSSGRGPNQAQLSFVFLKLREEIPGFFGGHHSYHLYADNLQYETQLWRFPWRGKGVISYTIFLRVWRVGVCSVCRRCEMDLLRITKDIESGKVEARWRMRGRYLWSKQQRVLLEGFSTFLVNSDGLISRHELSRIQPPRKDSLRSRTWVWLSQLLGRKVPQPQV